MIDLRDRIARAFGLRHQDRESVVRAMLDRHHDYQSRVGYWLQLGLATGIATLGLVLGSTGVVIGAMLISPLMGPLVELGMGLAIGSPILATRAFTRTSGSVAVVLGSAAVMTLLMPYQEVTGEIAARTAPTVLDLLVAVFCALAAVFTTVRSSSDTTAAAAGTAIGIALVPPLCVGGFGLGTGLFRVAGGALLLFTANLSAILLVAVGCFLLLRFDKVAVHALEHDMLEAGTGPSGKLGRWLHAFFGARYSRLLRVLLPLVMAAAVFVPLRQALSELTWEVRVRTQLRELLQSIPEAQGAIRSVTSVEHHTVAIRLVIVGSPQDGAKLEEALKLKAAALAGVEPFVEVTAIPRAAVLIERPEPRLPVAPPPPPPLPLATRLGAVKSELASAVRDSWPQDSAGPLLRASLSVQQDGTPTLDIVHLGPPLGPSGERLLASLLQAKLNVQLEVRERALPTEEAEASAQAGLSWLPSLVRALDGLREDGTLHVCVLTPAPAGSRQERADMDRVAGLVHSLVATAQPGRASVTLADRWSVRLSTAACPKEEAADGGTATAGQPAAPAR